MTQVWLADGDVLNALLGGYPSPSAKRRSASASMFFIDILPVSPSRFRPLSIMEEKRFENPQTANLNKIMKSCVLVRQCLQDLSKKSDESQEAIVVQEDEQKKKYKGRNAIVAMGKTPAERLQNAWLGLQSAVNCLMDSDLDKVSTEKNPGVRQILEKKEGLFRKHMMGKRVDYAARSVISPDPYISVDEIGIPEVFALKLTYPQPVTTWNVKELRQAVINGPNIHPGATLVEHEDGKRTLLSPTDANQRQAIAKRLLTPSMDSSKAAVMHCKKVYRHLKNGDVLLLNRQPTLHRPSIMAHKARVLPNEKTIRLHYANCKAYNADFDGDEMNAHFPQNELARSEAYNLASTNYQYLVPKDGTPLSGLIQDHMVSGVRMTVRGMMFNRLDYQQLVYSALDRKHDVIRLLRPCILKPCELWSGKQVVSTVIQNLIPKDSKLLNLSGKAKISGKSWITRKPKRHFTNKPTVKEDEMSEAQVLIRGGELLCGVLDKGHYGPTPYGLVHCCHELYGGVMSGQLLSSLARLFTAFLQIHGFTLGVEDILVTPGADKKRRKFIGKGRESGAEAAQSAVGLPEDCERSALEEALQAAHHGKDGNDMKELDLQMKRKTDHFQDLINKACIPLGLHKRFPANNLQLMVNSGAKGSAVNCMQISCLLGQIELEGRRPPLMPSGRSLPSFLPYDTSPRAGGFVDGRFLTGIRPQEYFFHCMAGREGLVDTAVKTSRSGYLQRCLIKHLEGLQVSYDLSVRDSDGSLVQFYYGEDGLDICKTPFLSDKQYPFMASNMTALLHQFSPKALLPHLDTTHSEKHMAKIAKWREKHQGEDTTRTSPFLRFAKEHVDEVQAEHSSEPTAFGRSKADMRLFELWHSTPMPVRSRFARKCRRCPDPVLSKLRPDTHFGALSENFTDTLNSYTDNLQQRAAHESGKLAAGKFRGLMFLRAYRALAQPGEAVGLLAAQSIGEPSTQMTLNTFHFAGRGEMNVTLGIPRLREILMTASANIKTPTMDIPLRAGKKAQKRAKKLQLQFTRVYLSQVLKSVDVWESLSPKEAQTRHRMYRVRFEFLPEKSYQDKFVTSPATVLQHMEGVFIKRLISSVQKTMRIKQNQSMLDSAQEDTATSANENGGREPVDEDDDNAELSDEEQADGDAAELKQRQRREQHASYEAPDLDEEEIEKELREIDDSENEDDDRMPPVTEDDDGTSTVADSEFSEGSFSGMSMKSKMNDARVKAVVNSDVRVARYRYDSDEELWCEVTLKFPVSQWKVRVSSVIEKLAQQTVVYETPGIRRCFMAEEKGAALLRTDGVNLQAVWRHPDVLAVDKLYTNDIHAVANTYGIEAAAQAIKKEIKNVFSAYGIRVDPRHLSLVSDYMTTEGRIKAFNRIGIESNASPFQKMSFETTTHFLRGAVISGDTEQLTSPSSRLVVGRVVGTGTGCFDILQPLA